MAHRHLIETKNHFLMTDFNSYMWHEDWPSPHLFLNVPVILRKKVWRCPSPAFLKKGQTVNSQWEIAG